MLSFVPDVKLSNMSKAVIIFGALSFAASLCNLFVDTTELTERSDPANSIVGCFITLATFEIVQAVKRWCFGRMKRIQSSLLNLLLVLGLLVSDFNILLFFLNILYSNFLGCIRRDQYPFDIALTASTHGVTLFIIVVSCGRSTLYEMFKTLKDLGVWRQDETKVLPKQPILPKKIVPPARDNATHVLRQPSMRMSIDNGELQADPGVADVIIEMTEHLTTSKGSKDMAVEKIVEMQSALIGALDLTASEGSKELAVDKMVEAQSKLVGAPEASIPGNACSSSKDESNNPYSRPRKPVQPAVSLDSRAVHLEATRKAKKKELEIQLQRLKRQKQLQEEARQEKLAKKIFWSLFRHAVAAVILPGVGNGIMAGMDVVDVVDMANTISDASDQIDAFQGQLDALDSLQDFNDQIYGTDYLDIGGMEDQGVDDEVYDTSTQGHHEVHFGQSQDGVDHNGEHVVKQDSGAVTKDDVPVSRNDFTPT